MNVFAKHTSLITLISTVAFVAIPTLVLAQQAGLNPAISGNGTNSQATCTQIINSASVGQANGVLAALAVFLSGTPFRIGAFIGIVVAAITLLLDSGHLSHIVQRVLVSLMIIVILGVLTGFIFGTNSALAQC